MLLPFVRDFFADVEKSGPFARLVSQLKREGGHEAGAGRTSVSGLTPTAKALHLALLQRALDRPLVVIVPTNRAAEELLPIVRSFCELTSGAPASRVVQLPAYDILPFENLSPHPEIQEMRAVSLWKMATGEASIVLAPIASAAMRLRPRQQYAEQAAEGRGGQLALLLGQVLPQVQEGDEIRIRVGEPAVLVVGGLLGLGRALARVLDGQRRRDDQYLADAAVPVRFEDHPAD